MRVMHVKLPSHSAGGRYVVKAASQCVCAYLDRSLAMRLLKPSSLPQCVFAMRLRLPNASSQCVCAYPMRLRNASAPPNASSQCVCATQCVFTMRLRLPCVCAFQCVFTQCVFRLRLRLLMRLRLLGLFLTNASSQCGCVFRSFTTLPQDAAIHLFIYPLIHQFIHSSVHSNHFFIQSFMQPIQFNSIQFIQFIQLIQFIQFIQFN